MVIGLITGSFEHLHLGDIASINEAASRCDVLIVGLNTDSWVIRKYGECNVPWHDRAANIKSLPSVADVIYFNDDDNTVSYAIQKVRKRYPTEPIMFMARDIKDIKNIPELTEPGIEFVPV